MRRASLGTSPPFQRSHSRSTVKPLARRSPMNSHRRPRLALLGAAVTLTLLGLEAAGQPGPRPPEGFEALFNGRDLKGWEGSTQDWKVEDGCLTGTADGKLKYNRFLVWGGDTVKNFELRVRVRVSPGGNSGINYRSTPRPDLGDSVVTGYQCDVVANRADYNGMLYEERGRRILAHIDGHPTVDVIDLDAKG